MKIHFIANGIFSERIAGGDTVFFQAARAAYAAGYEVHFFGGTAFKKIFERHGLQGTFTLTDSRSLPDGAGYLAMLWDFFKRFWQTLMLLDQIGAHDIVCAATDYWFDTLPAALSRACLKTMIWTMAAPTLKEVLTHGRPDVSWPNSFYYWASQKISLALFKSQRIFCHNRKLMAGLKDACYLPGGVNVTAIDKIPSQSKIYDLIWLGRNHPQKGIDDLVNIIHAMDARIPDFRCLIVGQVEELKPRLDLPSVHFAGYVHGAEQRYTLFKQSRVFVQPSKFEGWGLVNGEAIACGLRVVAYDLKYYHPSFDGLINFIPCFDVYWFAQITEAEILKARDWQASLDAKTFSSFKLENSLESFSRAFVKGLEFAI